MAFYEFRCRTCDTRFEVSRPMSQANAPAVCPNGHEDTVKLLSSFAAVGVSSGASSGTAACGIPAAAAASGCAGGACACS